MNILRTFEPTPKIAASKFCERYHKKFSSGGQNAFNVEYKGFHDLDELMSSIPGVSVIPAGPSAHSSKYFQCSVEHINRALKGNGGADKGSPKLKFVVKKSQTNGVVSPRSEPSSKASSSDAQVHYMPIFFFAIY